MRFVCFFFFLFFNSTSFSNSGITDEDKVFLEKIEYPFCKISKTGEILSVRKCKSVHNLEDYKYIGTFVKRIEEGFGKYIFSSGNVYVGDISDGFMEGEGVFYFKNGIVYEGQFKNDYFNGFGVMSYKDGSIFEGEFVDDLAEGLGTYYYSENDPSGIIKSEGYYQDDLPEGKFKYTLQDGSIEHTFFKNGKAVEDNQNIGESEGIKTEKNADLDRGDLVPISSGSGFFVNTSGHLLSNHHVTEHCQSIKAIYQGNEYEVDVLASDPRTDISLGLIKKLKNDHYITFGNRANLADDIYVFGFPLSDILSKSVKVTKGIVNSLIGFKNDYSLIQIDAAIQPGNSGGPIVNANSGNLLAMAVSTVNEAQNVNFGIKVQNLKIFLDSHKIRFFESSDKENISKPEVVNRVSKATLDLHCYNTVEYARKLYESGKVSNLLIDIKQ